MTKNIYTQLKKKVLNLNTTFSHVNLPTSIFFSAGLKKKNEYMKANGTITSGKQLSMIDNSGLLCPSV